MAHPTFGFREHPPGLATLFFTEMWERFSFYGLQALLILYLVLPRNEGGVGLSVSHVAGQRGRSQCRHDQQRHSSAVRIRTKAS